MLSYTVYKLNIKVNQINDLLSKEIAILQKLNKGSKESKENREKKSRKKPEKNISK
jgi:hypothetical protein